MTVLFNYLFHKELKLLTCGSLMMSMFIDYSSVYGPWKISFRSYLKGAAIIFTLYVREKEEISKMMDHRDWYAFHKWTNCRRWFIFIFNYDFSYWSLCLSFFYGWSTSIKKCNYEFWICVTTYWLKIGMSRLGWF